MKIYNCEKVVLYPPENFIPCNYVDGYKDSILVDRCLANEIEYLWNQGIVTRGCCCGHGRELGFINVSKESVGKMLDLGYQFYIFPEEFGGIDRKDTFIPKSTYHFFEGYSDGYLG